MKILTKQQSLRKKRELRRERYLYDYRDIKSRVKKAIKRGDRELNIVPFSGWSLELSNHSNQSEERIAVRLFLRKNKNIKLIKRLSTGSEYLYLTW